MDIRPPALARKIPFLGLLLILEAAVGVLIFLERAMDPEADVLYIVLILILGVFCAMRRNAAQEPGKCRILLVTALFLNLGGQVLRMMFNYPGQRLPPFLLMSALASWCFVLGIVGILGSALALREDGTNRVHPKIRRGAVVATAIGFGIVLLSEGLRFLQYRAAAPLSLGFSIWTFFLVLVRGGLAVAAVFSALPAAADGAVALRREALILKAASFSIAANLLSWVVFTVMVVFRIVPNLTNPARNLWFGFLSITLLLLGAALVSVSHRNPEDARP